MKDLNYSELRRYAERLAKERGISINRAMRQIVKYKRWKDKRRK